MRQKNKYAQSAQGQQRARAYGYERQVEAQPSHPQLTIGMAHFEDLDSIVMMIQAIRLYHQPLQDVELVVIDNSPHTDSGRELRKFMASVASGAGGAYSFFAVKYVPFDASGGTTQTRERIFAEAAGEAVLVMDCHVLPFPGAIQGLLNYYRQHPTCMDLISGPLFYDPLVGWDTQFNDVFRSEMWGVWGGAWRCGCSPQGKKFTVVPARPGILRCSEMLDQLRPAGECPLCKKEIPAELVEHAWQEQLLQVGYQPCGGRRDEEPFEIPAMGLGLFSCRRDAWLGFHPHFREFGGEEMYIHEKFRQAGRKVICLPDLPWWHKFQRVGGPKYGFTKLGKVRNLVLGHEEIGRPLDRIRSHFFDLTVPAEHGDLATHLAWEHGIGQEHLTGKTTEELVAIHQRCKVTKEQWEQLMTDPVQAVSQIVEKSTRQFQALLPQPPGELKSLAELYAWVEAAGRDDAGHLAQLRALARHCRSVLEVTKRRETTVALATGLCESQAEGEGPKKYLLSQREMDLLVPRTLVAMLEADAGLELVTRFDARESIEDQLPESAELLFVDDVQTAAHLLDTLNLLGDRVTKWIVVRGTEAFGNLAEGSTEKEPRPGLYPGWQAWVSGSEERQVWRRVAHDETFYGLTVFSRVPTDRSIDWGPGSVLQAMFKEIQFDTPPGCDCNRIAREMNALGPEGCVVEFDAIVARMKEGQNHWGWATHFAAIRSAAIALTTPWGMSINWLDPIPSLVQLAIERAREQEAKLYREPVEGVPAIAPPIEFTPPLLYQGVELPAVVDQLPQPLVYFDVDGVLNNTPARGDLGFGVDPEKCRILAALPGTKVCISCWRNSDADKIVLPFPFYLAPKGEKRKSHPHAAIIIDDQPSLYDEDAPLYHVAGPDGLTREDGERLDKRLMEIRYRILDQEVARD